MNVEVPDGSNKVFKLPQTQPVKRRKNKKKKKNASKRNNVNNSHPVTKVSEFALTMSNWAESFTFASTWQLKHQLAYWKARAKSLEYENSVLHDLIRKNNFFTSHTNTTNTRDPSRSQSESSMEDEDIAEQTEEDKDEEGLDFEVSEEYIQFLTTNAKYREEVRLERERLKAVEENPESADHDESSEDKEAKLKELYGEKWQRICALETSLLSKFINDSDKDKAVYWPNIPLNFNFS